MSDERPSRRQGRRERRPLVPDQAGKLDYILNVRGDRRRRDPRQPAFAKPDPDGWRGLAGRTKVVSTQAGLAALLDSDAATVSRWFNGHEAIPSLELATICRVFDVDELYFRTDSFDSFKARCEGGLAVGALPAGGGWRRLLARAERGRLQILLEDPVGDPYASGEHHRRYASTRPSAEETPPVTVVQGQPFWISASSPSDADGAPLWAGWSLLLLNEDRGRDGFKSLVPGDVEPDVFGPSQFPADARTFYAPRQPILRHQGEVGQFAMILVLSAERCPYEVTTRLAEAGAEGRVIESTLDHLAAWLEPRLEEGNSVLLTAVYQVVKRTNSA